jgi:protein-disulfide isomerase
VNARLETVVNVLVGIAALVAISISISGYIARSPGSLRSATPPKPELVENLELTINDAVVRRSGATKLALIEFSDFLCPYCAKHATGTFARIDTELVQRNRLAYVFVNFPLQNLHPQAFRVAEAAECAAEQGRFWEMHGRLFANQRAVDAAALVDHASAVQLDLAAFDSCLREGRGHKIQRHIDEGKRLGVRSTPTFFIGEFTDGGRVRLFHRLRGAQAFTAFEDLLNGLRAAPKARSWF